MTSFFSTFLKLLPFFQVFNNSPDETAYFRMILNRENVANSVVMIQPSLISYSFQSGPEPALLDVTAIAADRILLLDSYFTVVLFHGASIAQWRNAGYQNQSGHEVILLAILTHNNYAFFAEFYFIYIIWITRELVVYLILDFRHLCHMQDDLHAYFKAGCLYFFIFNLGLCLNFQDEGHCVAVPLVIYHSNILDLRSNVLISFMLMLIFTMISMTGSCLRILLHLIFLTSIH